MTQPQPVVLLDLAADFGPVANAVSLAIEAVVARQQFINGPEVAQFEAALAALSPSQDAVAVSSGTDALLASLMALGVKPGDEVITSPFTFFATAGSIARAGATPRFADIEPASFNIDPESVAALVGPRTVGILPVHLFGQMAQMNAIGAIASRNGLFVLEDAAQAIGATQMGVHPGSMGAAAALSFFPSKNLGAMGDAGAVVSNDRALVEVLRRLREHGSADRYHHSTVGGNFRMDTLQAAVLLAKLPMLDTWTNGRRSNALGYRDLFSEAGMVSSSVSEAAIEEGKVVLPHTSPGNSHVFNQYVIRVAMRDELASYLREHGVGHAVYYPIPLHLQPCFEYLGYRKGQLPHAERAAEEVLALPIYPGLPRGDQERVVQSIRTFFNEPSSG